MHYTGLLNKEKSNRNQILKAKELFENSPGLWATAVNYLKSEGKLPKSGFEREKAIIVLIEKMQGTTKVKE